MTSIRARLLIALMILVAVVSLLSAVVTYRRVLSETSSLFDYQLRQMALSLRNQISVAPRIEVPPDQGDMDFVIQIWDVFGTRVYLSRPGLPMINQVVLGFADLNVRGQAWRAYGLQTSQGVVQIAQPARVREVLARSAALRIVVPLMLLLPVMILCVTWIVQRGLSPLRYVTREVQRRDAGSLSPLPHDSLPLEITPLVEELNRLLARLGSAFTAQRDFIADAAHELRSPLTALRLQLQLLDRAPDEAARAEARALLGAAIDRAIHLVEQLLTLARSDPEAPSADLTIIDLTDVTALAIADAHALALTRCIDLGLDAPVRLSVKADADALRALVRNLVDNAVRYTPPGGTVHVRCAASPRGPRLLVADNGPGIPPEDQTRVFDRFYRRAGSAEGGSGLGLAIVKAIALHHGAEISLTQSAAGGLEVMVQFPPVS